MEQYISKSAVKAEIRKYIKSAEAFLKYHHNRNDKSVYAFEQEKLVMCDLLYFIDNLEVKEIDLEDSIKESLVQKYIDYTFKRHNIDPESREGLLIYYAYMHGMNQCLDKLNAQKGE